MPATGRGAGGRTSLEWPLQWTSSGAVVLSVESREQLLSHIRGHRIAQAVYVATRLGIPDLLADGPREIDELAHATGSHPPSLRRVLMFLAGAGVLEKVGPRRFALTEVAALL